MSSMHARHAPRLPALSVALLAALALPCTTAAGQADAEAAIKATLKPVAKSHTLQLKAFLKPLAEQLKASKKAVSSGASAPDAGIDTLADAATALSLDLPFLTDITLIFEVQASLEDVLFGLSSLPQGALVGAGGTFDKTITAIEKRHRATQIKGRKALIGLVKTLAKKGLPVALQSPDTQLVAIAPNVMEEPERDDEEEEESKDSLGNPISNAPSSAGPGDGGPPPPPFGNPFSALALGVLVGSSDPDVPGDGSLRIDGTTISKFESVMISGQGPNGATFGPVSVSPDPTNGGFTTTVAGLPEGNWRVQASQASAFAADYVGVPGAPDPGADPIDAKTAAKDAKTGWKSLVKQHGTEVKARLKELTTGFKSLQAGIAGGGDEAQAVEDLFASLVDFSQLVDEATNTGVGDGARVKLGGALDALEQVVPDHLVGNGLANDAAFARVDKACVGAALKSLKAARAFGKFLSKSGDWRLSVDLEPVQFRRAAPVAGAELDELPVSMRVDLLLGASQQGVAGDGVLLIHATGNDVLGEDINVTASGPEGLVVATQIIARDAAGGVTVRFPASGPGNLPEGNYQVVLQQGAMVSSAAISIPGGP